MNPALLTAALAHRPTDPAPRVVAEPTPSPAPTIPVGFGLPESTRLGLDEPLSARLRADLDLLREQVAQLQDALQTLLAEREAAAGKRRRAS